MIAVALLIVLLAVYGFWEFRRHQRNIDKVPIRILVNGTRGKSSVTRLITGGLQAGGLRTLGKTTGTKPRYIYPDGSEIPIERVGRANIIEQLKVQLEGVLATMVYSAVVTFIILKVIDLVIGIRVSADDERMGLDLSQHGERVD